MTMIRIRSMLAGGALLAFGLLMAGCASSSPMSRIDANRALYESWPIDVREAVLSGRVINDMTPEQVEMSVGKPAVKTVRSGRSGTEDIWIYREGSGGLGSTTIGGGFGGIGVYKQGGGEVGEEYEVVFKDGRVVRTTFPQ
jgi:hypothetical protein